MTQMTLEDFVTLGIATTIAFFGGAVSEFLIQKSKYSKESIQLRSSINKYVFPSGVSGLIIYEALSTGNPQYIGAISIPAAFSCGANFSKIIFDAGLNVYDNYFSKPKKHDIENDEFNPYATPKSFFETMKT